LKPKHAPSQSVRTPVSEPKRTHAYSVRVVAALLVVVAVVAIVAWKAVSARTAGPPASDPATQIEWVEQNRHPAMIVYHSNNCIPCKAMSTLVEQVRGDYEPRITFIDVLTNDEANLDLLRKAAIQYIPTSFFVSAAGESKRVVGAMSEPALRAELDRLVSGKE